MYGYPRVSRRGGGGCGGRLIFAPIIAAVCLFSYFGSRQDNAVTGATQYIGITVEQEIALGLQAAPQMAAEFGGEDPDANAQALVDQVGNLIVQSSPASQTPYEYEFHLLEDNQTINAFALPGGQIFITRALFDRLQTEGELAGVLGHEVGHVVARHSAEQMAKGQLGQSLATAVAVGASDGSHKGQLAAMAGMMA